MSLTGHDRAGLLVRPGLAASTTIVPVLTLRAGPDARVRVVPVLTIGALVAPIAAAGTPIRAGPAAGLLVPRVPALLA